MIQSHPRILSAMGRRIEAARRAKRLTKNECAARAGISPRALDYLEHGEREPMAGTIFALSEALGVSVTYLWTGRND